MKKLHGLIPLLIVAVLWVAGSQTMNPLFLPSPVKTFETAQVMIANGQLQESLVSSFTRISVATVASGLLSVFIGLLVVNYKFVNNIITPITNTSRFIPITAFYPLLIMWLGIGESMKISFLFVATFLFFLPATIAIFNDTDQRLIDTGLTMGMNKLQLTNNVILPNAFPTLFKNFLTMYGIGWTYVIIAETINTNTGLGHIMHIGSARGRTDMVFVAIVTIVLFNFAFDWLGTKGIKKAFPWKGATTMEDSE